MGALLAEPHQPPLHLQVFIMPDDEMSGGKVLHTSRELDEMGFRIEHASPPHPGAACGRARDRRAIPWHRGWDTPVQWSTAAHGRPQAPEWPTGADYDRPGVVRGVPSQSRGTSCTAMRRLTWSSTALAMRFRRDCPSWASFVIESFGRPGSCGVAIASSMNSYRGLSSASSSLSTTSRMRARSIIEAT